MDVGLEPLVACDLVGTPSRHVTRVRAFLKGRFWELLNTSFDVTNHPHLPQNETHYSPDSPPSTRSLRSRALEVLDLVRLGELSRDHGLTFNQALQVFNHWEWLNTCYR